MLFSLKILILHEPNVSAFSEHLYQEDVHQGEEPVRQPPTRTPQIYPSWIQEPPGIYNILNFLIT